jgi:prevent-host-death family protein
MQKATVSKLKNNLSAYLRKVRAGEPVLIYDRDVPIARIERIESSGRGGDRLALPRPNDCCACTPCARRTAYS